MNICLINLKNKAIFKIKSFSLDDIFQDFRQIIFQNHFTSELFGIFSKNGHLFMTSAKRVELLLPQYPQPFYFGLIPSFL